MSLRLLVLVAASWSLAMAGCVSGGPAESSDPPPEPRAVFPAPNADWPTTTPEQAGLDPAALEAALELARANRSSAMVVVAGGRIVAERSWSVAERAGSTYPRMVVGTTADGRAVEDVASVQKSVVSFLVGVAEGKGLIALDAPVSRYVGVGWSSASAEQEGAITVEHLLTMTSGLAVDGSYEAPAGERWRYNTRVYARLLPVLEKATGRSTQELTAEWLTAPIGMTESRWAERPWVEGGQDANTAGFATSARDLARFGLLVLRGGIWNGVDLLGNPGYLERALSPSQDLNPAYGYLWWLNGQERLLRAGGVEVDGPLIASAPADLVAAQGALGRTCYVVPSRDLVVTRLGDQPDEGFAEELWRLLLTTPTAADRIRR